MNGQPTNNLNYKRVVNIYATNNPNGVNGSNYKGKRKSHGPDFRGANNNKGGSPY